MELRQSLYRDPRDGMLAALERELPATVRWTRLSGGGLWLSLPPRLDASRLRKVALAQGVAFVPEAPLHPLGGGADTLRLNFSHGDPR
ncbi:MAG: aminotransferase, partial [Chloroflexaceae bacterium]